MGRESEAGSTAARSGTTVSLGRDATITFRVVGEETGGAYSVLEYQAGPGAGSGLHTHRHEDETFYILEGAMTFQLGDHGERAAAGSIVTIPVGTRHAFANAEDVPVRALIILRPAGLEGFFADIAALIAAHPEGIPGEAVARIAERYGLDFS